MKKHLKCTNWRNSSATSSATSSAPLNETSDAPSFVSLCKLLSESLGAASIYPQVHP